MPIEVDMDKAKNIHRDLLRIYRKKRGVFDELDQQYMKATEKQQDTVEIIRKKQELRDLPQNPAIDKVTTILELKALWPKDTLGVIE